MCVIGFLTSGYHPPLPILLPCVCTVATLPEHRKYQVRFRPKMAHFARVYPLAGVIFTLFA
ncbi:hypothetical protein SBV1_520013 [Verrucomicrobia bacterium]|nr:hypothetical protein SBV1_520013 [Verrucomicrobiota bacterium]